MAEYRKIPGYVGYRVGDDGSVWSCWRFKGAGRGGIPTRVISSSWRRLKPYKDHNGYLRFELGKGNRVYGHVLVLTAFVGPCPPGMQCCHFPDRTPTNNQLENLRWGTPIQNSQDRDIHGTTASGEKNGNHSLTEEDVRAMRLDHSQGMSQRGLGRKYNTPKTTVSHVIKRRTWKHIV